MLSITWLSFIFYTRRVNISTLSLAVKVSEIYTGNENSSARMQKALLHLKEMARQATAFLPQELLAAPGVGGSWGCRIEVCINAPRWAATTHMCMHDAVL